LILIAALGKSTLCLWPESTAPYNCQGRFILHPSWLYILIPSGSIYLWRNDVLYWVNCPCSKQFIHPWHTNISLPEEIACSSVLGFWEPWVLFSVVGAWACPNFDPKGTITESRERCWTLCFPWHICAKWARTTLYFKISLLIVALVPTFYNVSYKVSPNIHIFIFSAYSNIVLSKAPRCLCPWSRRRATRSL
jgi:hypothetical protein